MPPGKLQEYTFDITHEEIVKKRYLTLYNRRIRFPAHENKLVMACCLIAQLQPSFKAMHMQPEWLYIL